MKRGTKQSKILRFAALAAILVGFAATITHAQQIPVQERLRALNNQVLQLHQELTRGVPGDISLLRRNAGVALRARQAELRALAQRDTQKALSLTLSPELLADLAAKFSDSAPFLESHGRWHGPVEYWIADSADLRSHQTSVQMKVGEETLEVYFASAEPSGLRSGDTLAVEGVRSGSMVIAATGSVPASTAGGKPSATSASVRTTASGTCSTTSVQNIAVLLVTFPDVVLPQGVTAASLHDTFFGTAGRSLDGYWREASYGQTFAAGEVFGPYTLSRSYTCSEAGLMRDEAIAMAAAQGADFQDYTRIFVIYPHVGCVAGIAQVGCYTLSTPSGSIIASSTYISADYVSGEQGVQLATHEAGHNLGLQHSGTLGFGTEPLGPLGAAGTVNEFGDYWSTMGSQSPGIYPAPQKAQVLQWMAPGTNYQVVQSSGVFTLQPLETSPPGLQALKIQRGTGNNEWLWVEYRQPVGNYDSTLMTQPFGGALIHHEDPATGAFTHLLDFSPDGSWNTWWFPALLAGQAWVDPYTNLSITVQSATASGLTVAVEYSGATCTHAIPSVSLSPQNPSGSAGGSVNYTIQVTNRDSGECAASTFDLSSNNPSGWQTIFSSSAVTLNPGETGAVTFTMVVPSGTTPGTYPVDAVAANGSYTGTGAANCTVTAPSSLAVSLSVPNSTYSVKQTVSMTATVSYGAAPTKGATVKFTMARPGGGTSTKSMTTDASGKAVWNYRIGRNGPWGTYSTVASATYSSQTATSNIATFIVD